MTLTDLEIKEVAQLLTENENTQSKIDELNTTITRMEVEKTTFLNKIEENNNRINTIKNNGEDEKEPVNINE